MALTVARTLAALGLVSLVVGCSGGDRAGADPADSASSGSTGGVPAPPRPPLPAPDSAPATDSVRDGSVVPANPPGTGLGKWDIVALEKRLDLQGMAPRKRPEPVRHPFLSVEGVAYLVGNAELQAFIYEDAAAVERDLARLDTIAVAPRGQRVKWPDKPTLIRNNNLAAILLGQNALQIERVQRALMAGLPPAP